jgi:DNA-binding winged helix-turn-helix (wHTH) protein/Tol biopolymer transport system component
VQDTVNSPQRVRFGVFEVDLRAGELWKSGRKKKLTGQPFAVLAILLERPGEVISREELQKRLWPDTFVDVDHNLNTAINKIREALDDSSERPQFVETLPRRGYRFIAPVESVQAATPGLNGTAAASNVTAEAESAGVGTSAAAVPSANAFEPASARAEGSRPLNFQRVAGWAAIAIAALVLAWFLRPALPAPIVTGTEQLTRDGIQKLRFWGFPPPASQTDGSTVYFVETSGLSDKLMQVSTEGGDAVPISVPLDFIGISNIAPDRPELLIAGTPNVPEAYRVWRVPVPAGQPRPIGSLVAGDVAFSPDATVLFFSRGSDIFRANSDGSDPRKILTTNGQPYWLRVSPDGRLLRFSVLQTPFSTSTLWEAQLDGSHMRQLLADWDSTNVCCGNWTSDGRYFIFQATHEGVGNLWAMREKSDLWRKTSHIPVQLTVGESNSQAPLPSKDSRKVFFLGVTRHGELVRYDPKTRGFSPYLSGLSAEGVAFSSDGKKVAYVTFPEGILWESGTDGSGKRQLSFPPMRVGLPKWSQDGTRIAFSGRAPGKTFQLYLVSAEGGDPEQLTSGGSDKYDPAWSPDGNSMAFGGSPLLRSSDAPAIHMVNLKTRQITDIPGSAKLYSPRWSPDGRYLLALTVDFQKIVLYNFAQQKWEDLVTMTQPSYPAWSHDAKCVYFANPYADPKEPVYRICLNDRKLVHIVDLSDAGRLAEGQFGRWTGIAPDDSILGTRDISIEEIYALDTKFP